MEGSDSPLSGSPVIVDVINWQSKLCGEEREYYSDESDGESKGQKYSQVIITTKQLHGSAQEGKMDMAELLEHNDVYFPEGVSTQKVAERIDAIVYSYFQTLAKNSTSDIADLDGSVDFTIQIRHYKVRDNKEWTTVKLFFGGNCLPRIAYPTGKSESVVLHSDIAKPGITLFETTNKLEFHPIDPEKMSEAVVAPYVESHFGGEEGQKWADPLHDLYSYLNTTSLYLRCGIGEFTIEKDQKEHEAAKPPFTLVISPLVDNPGFGKQADFKTQIEEILGVEGSSLVAQLLPVTDEDESVVRIKFTEKKEPEAKPDKGGTDETSLCSQFCDWLYSVWKAIIGCLFQQ